VRPSHLAIGTHADNVNDMVQANRQASGSRHGSKTKPERLAKGERHGSHTKPEAWTRGESHHKAKLAERDVIEIQRSLKHYYRGLCVELAKKYGVSPETIYDIKSGRRWKHIKWDGVT